MRGKGWKFTQRFVIQAHLGYGTGTPGGGREKEWGGEDGQRGALPGWALPWQYGGVWEAED